MAFCVYLCLGLEFTVLHSSWQILLAYVFSESLYMTQWLIRMSVVHHGVCVGCVCTCVFEHFSTSGVWIIAVCLYVCVCELAFKPPAHSIQSLLIFFFFLHLHHFPISVLSLFLYVSLSLFFSLSILISRSSCPLLV